ncbi:hypothetical protein BASA81_012640 [Batrachochytrium salamandrivorans]|nr:hypothetical protein BASA81_012640 [Batrachochytrium salamandrivorans]
MQQPPTANRSSLHVLRAYFERLPNGELDASQVISRRCYLNWLASKQASESNIQAKRFHRALTNHVAGNGRCPFEKDEEAALLVLLRKKESWPCFPSALAHFGKRFRAVGHHERSSTARMATPTTTVVTNTDLDAAQENITQMLLQLKAEDASYLARLSGHIVCNFAQDFSYEDRESVGEIIRFMILGRTLRCRQTAECGLKQAKALCQSFSYASPSSTVVFVLDMAAKSDPERVLAQNLPANEFCGKLEGAFGSQLVQRSDLFRCFVAMGGAYHKPGTEFTVTKQTLSGTTAMLFDVTYYVDPETLYLVLLGAPSFST